MQGKLFVDERVVVQRMAGLQYRVATEDIFLHLKFPCSTIEVDCRQYARVGLRVQGAGRRVQGVGCRGVPRS